MKYTRVVIAMLTLFLAEASLAQAAPSYLTCKGRNPHTNRRATVSFLNVENEYPPREDYVLYRTHADDGRGTVLTKFTAFSTASPSPESVRYVDSDIRFTTSADAYEGVTVQFPVAQKAGKEFRATAVQIPARLVGGGIADEDVVLLKNPRCTISSQEFYEAAIKAAELGDPGNCGYCGG